MKQPASPIAFSSPHTYVRGVVLGVLSRLVGRTHGRESTFHVVADVSQDVYRQVWNSYLPDSPGGADPATDLIERAYDDLAARKYLEHLDRGCGENERLWLSEASRALLLDYFLGKIEVMPDEVGAQPTSAEGSGSDSDSDPPKPALIQLCSLSVKWVGENSDRLELREGHKVPRVVGALSQGARFSANWLGWVVQFAQRKPFTTTGEKARKSVKRFLKFLGRYEIEVIETKIKPGTYRYAVSSLTPFALDLVEKQGRRQDELRIEQAKPDLLF